MFRKNFITALTVAAFTSLVGCASLTTGNTQSVSVKTGSINDATCSLENSKGKWYVNKTPGSVTINRSFKDLSIDCEKKGYSKEHKMIASSIKPMTFGNIIFGGPLGVGVDVVDGAAYEYPTEINVPMKKGIV